MDFHGVVDSVKGKFMQLSLRNRILSAVAGLLIAAYGVQHFRHRHVIIHIKNSIVSPNSMYLPSVLANINDGFMVVTSIGINSKDHPEKGVLNKNIYNCRIQPGHSGSVTFSYPRDGQYGVYVANKRGLALWFPVYFSNGNEYFIDLAYGSFTLNGVSPISSSF